MKYVLYILGSLIFIGWVIIINTEYEPTTEVIKLPTEIVGTTQDSVHVKLYLTEPKCIIYLDNPEESVRVRGDTIYYINSGYMLVSKERWVCRVNINRTAEVNQYFLNALGE